MNTLSISKQKAHSVPELLRIINVQHENLKSLETSTKALIEKHKELLSIIEDTQPLLTSKGTMQLLGIEHHSQLSVLKRQGLPFLSARGIGHRFKKLDVLRWMHKQKGVIQKRINVAAAM